MTLDALKALMPPPSEPVYPGSKEEWEAVQKKVGFRLPSDFFALLNTYGSGRFLAGEFKVANPFDPDDKNFANKEIATMRERKEHAPDAVPYPIIPEKGGLYPFGIDGNGNTFLWLTSGNPDDWKIACFNSEDYSETVKHSLTELLLLLASNKLKINRKKFWGSDFTQDHLEFIPRRLSPKNKRKPKS